MSDLQELFLDELADMYNAEKQITKALPKMVKSAESAQLRTAFQNHLKETEEHVSRLEEVFDLFGQRAKSKTCDAMKGIISEGKEILSTFKKNTALDAALISAAQKVEHYEIASYGCLCTWAKQLGNQRALRLLKQTLDEEKKADTKLTALAKERSNIKAARPELPAGRRNSRVRMATSRSR